MPGAHDNIIIHNNNNRLTSLFAVGYAIGPIVGGILSEKYGDVFPALASCLLFLLLIPATVFLLPETNPLVTSKQTQAPSLSQGQQRQRGGGGGGGGGGVNHDHAGGGGGEEGTEDARGARMRIMGLILLLMMPEFAVVSYSGTGLRTLVTNAGEGRWCVCACVRV